MKKLALSITVVAFIVFSVASCKNDVKKDTEEVKTEVKKEVKEEVEETMRDEDVAMATYQCPMKCEGDKTYGKPGQCPTCKMDLKEVKSDGDAEEQEHEEGEESEEQEG